tara:strand:+ start:144 stop:317 length:174 start_codon:yes stop_codon:yes gene_type:complete
MPSRKLYMNIENKIQKDRQKKNKKIANLFRLMMNVDYFERAFKHMEQLEKAKKNISK